MEYFPLTLEEKINKMRATKQAFTPQCISIVGIATLKALQYLHSQGVVHRDIKVQNSLSISQNSQIIYSSHGQLNLPSLTKSKSGT